MPIRFALALVVLLSATGCWLDACEQFEPSLGVPVCWETLNGPLTGEEPGPSSWCSGAETPMTSCRSLGYTASCQDFHARPEIARLPACQ